MIMLDNFIRPNSKKPLINLFDLIKESFAFANKLGETVSESYNDPYDAVKNRKPNKKELCIVFDNKVICILDTKMISVKWAVSCAKHVLHIFEEQYSNKIALKAIEAASNWIKDPSEKNKKICLDITNVDASFACAFNVSNAAYSAANAVCGAAYTSPTYARNAAFNAANASQNKSSEIKWQRKKLYQIVYEDILVLLVKSQYHRIENKLVRKIPKELLEYIGSFIA